MAKHYYRVNTHPHGKKYSPAVAESFSMAVCTTTLKRPETCDKKKSELIWSQKSLSPSPIKQSWDKSVQAQTTEAQHNNPQDAK